MKEMLEHLINIIQKNDLESMFGEGSKVKINSVIYSTNNKKFLIDSILHATYKDIILEIEDDDGKKHNLDFYPMGVELLIQEGWKYIGLEQKLIFQNKLEIID